jgi:ribosomal protein S18 acetylase RimI-like enzyme
MEINIKNRDQIELTDSFKNKFADIYFQAFGRKITALIRPESKAREIIINSLNYDMALYALDERKNLLGFLGFQTGYKAFIRYSYHNFREYFNPVSAFLKWIILKLSVPGLQKTEIRIDSIAVDGSLRGKGVGTALIEHFFNFAKINNYKKIYLEVVDTNPEAKKLYRNLGFNTKKRVNYYFFARRAGFSAEDIMFKEI